MMLDHECLTTLPALKKDIAEAKRRCEEFDELHPYKLKPITYERTPVQGGRQDWGAVSDQRADLQLRHSRLLQTYRERERLARRYLAKMEDPLWAETLEALYIDGLSYEETAERVHFSSRTIYRIHDKALREFKMLSSIVRRQGLL